MALALGGGALVAFSLPPWGWWPLAIAGTAVLDQVVARRRWKIRFARGWVFGLGWYAPAMGWMWHLSIPGYLAAVAIYSTYLGVAAVLSPPGRYRRLGLPAAFTIAEALRFVWPFGGVPLASLGISQVAGPLAETARIGGALVLTWLAFQLGAGLSALVDRKWLPAAASIAVPVGAVVLAMTVAPSGRPTGETLEIAAVQGGGPQGTRAINTNSRDVFERHLRATQQIEGPVGLVLWPENVVDVFDFETSIERQEIAAEAARLQTPIAVGITEDAGERFLNAQVVVSPDGQLFSRYDKVQRVPFGEYVPLRGLLSALGAPVDQIARDAVAGTEPAIIDLPSGQRLGVAISWEVFFGPRARNSVRNGGQALLNPTNGSSYEGTIVQTQQVASSRLRALETGRWVVQAAPTGFSAFVSPDGEVLERTSVSEAAVITRTIELRSGRTWYTRLGDRTIVAFAAMVLLLAHVLASQDLTPRAARSPARR